MFQAVTSFLVVKGEGI